MVERDPKSLRGLALVRRGRLYIYGRKKIAVYVTRAAESLIGAHNIAAFVAHLSELMDALGAKSADVRKRGRAVDIHLIGGPFVSKHFKLERGGVHG